jgi:hypothetical protein
MQQANPTHRWSDADDVAALYGYRFGYQGLARSRSALAQALGIGADSFGMRIRNISFIDTGTGLSKYAKQTKRIYDQHRATPEPGLRAVVLAAIQRRRSVSSKKP